VAYIAPKLRSGLIDEMSFAFRIESGQWSPDYTEYRINRYDIHRGDVAIVGYGANPYTAASLRTAAAPSARARALLEIALAADPLNFPPANCGRGLALRSARTSPPGAAASGGRLTWTGASGIPSHQGDDEP
jgi:hypothetical protein